MISQDTIQQIIARIDIIDVVGGFVKLKKRGANYMGLCPFHNEKSPSFTVSPTKEIYKCFGCGKSGNSIGFLMEHEKYSYVEALRWLANRYHIEIEETAISPEKLIQQQQAESLYILNGFAQKFFSDYLWESEEGEAIGYSYLQERGFSDDIIRKFQLGYASEIKSHFAQAALEKQYNPDLLLKSGLVVNRYDEFVDNYRGRIIFPIHNQTGKVIGFGARIIKKNDKAPKYINTPENEIYIKSRILYGMYFARQAIDRADECLLVEGYTDVISLHQAGVENVVASGGTSLTADQLRLIRKYTNQLTIIYDGDGAGIKAALRGLDLALEEGLQVKLVLIPDKEDPDSYVRKVGAEEFRNFVAENKKDFILFQLDIALRDAGSDAYKRSLVVNQIAETISRINKAEDFTRQQEYIRQSSELLKIDEAGLHALVNKFLRERIQKEEKNFQQQSEQKKNQKGTTNSSAFSPDGSFVNFPEGGEEGFPDSFQLPADHPDADRFHGADPKSGTDLGSGREGFDSDSLRLLYQDEQQEQAVVKALLEHGLKAWDDQKTVAAYVFEELIEEDLFDNKLLLNIINEYKKLYEEGAEPTEKSFIYAENPQVSQLVMKLLEFPYELSDKWKEQFDMPVQDRDLLYKSEVAGTLNYLKLRKIKRLIVQNQKDLEKPQSMEELKDLLQTHVYLKQMEMEITRQIGTVILK